MKECVSCTKIEVSIPEFHFHKKFIFGRTFSRFVPTPTNNWYLFSAIIVWLCPKKSSPPHLLARGRNMRDDEEEEAWMRGANSLCSNNGRLWFSVNAGLRILLLASCRSYTLILCVMQYVDGLHVFYWWLSISHFIFVAVDFIIQSVVTILGLFSAL